MRADYHIWAVHNQRDQNGIGEMDQRKARQLLHNYNVHVNHGLFIGGGIYTTSIGGAFDYSGLGQNLEVVDGF